MRLKESCFNLHFCFPFHVSINFDRSGKCTGCWMVDDNAKIKIRENTEFPIRKMNLAKRELGSKFLYNTCSLQIIFT